MKNTSLSNPNKSLTLDGIHLRPNNTTIYLKLKFGTLKLNIKRKSDLFYNKNYLKVPDAIQQRGGNE